MNLQTMPKSISTTMFLWLFIMISMNMSMSVTQSSVNVNWEMFVISNFVMNLHINTDPVGLTFFTLVNVIFISIVMFSTDYMKQEMKINKFLLLMFMFFMSMALLIFSTSMLSMMLGWDGLGLISYLLVMFYSNKTSNKAGTITVLSNRVGDAAIILSIMLLYNQWGSTDYMTWNNHTPPSLIILASMTKSAQIPFSTWLPAAMAAPTPVSALVHSSTLVTAGVYLLVRWNSTSNVMLMLSSVTTIMSSASAMMESDLKKIVAYSTLSQLGIMMSTSSLGLQTLAMMHLMIHAVFKSLLFMSVGYIIHMSGGSQDTRSMSLTLKMMPYTSMVTTTSVLALVGMPFMSGFYSKDIILLKMMESPMSFIIMFMNIMSICLTSMYTYKLMKPLLHTHTSVNTTNSIKEGVNSMTLSMFMLSVLSTLVGSMMYYSMAITDNNYNTPSLNIKILMLMLLMSMFFTQIMYPPSKKPLLSTFMNNMWYMCELTSTMTKYTAISINTMNYFIDNKTLKYKSIVSQSTQNIKTLVMNETPSNKMTNTMAIIMTMIAMINLTM